MELNLDKICYYENNTIFFDVPTFKEVANLDNCEIIVYHIINTANKVLTQYNDYIVTINAKSLKITDLEKYLKFIKLFNILSMPIYSQLNICNIYNVPGTIKHIINFCKMFISKHTIKKINLCV